MKKIYFTLALAVGLLSTTALSAENAPQSTIHHDKTEEHHEGHHAKWWAGGSMTFWKDTDRKVTNFSFRPEIGHFLSEKWGIGAMLNYTHISGGEEAGRVYGITPFVRRYVFERGPFNIYFDGGVGLSWAQAKEQDSWSKATMGIEAGVRPGACLDLAKGLCLCLHMGFLGYRKSFAGGEGAELSPSGFGMHFAPEELSIGLELEF